MTAPIRAGVLAQWHATSMDARNSVIVVGYAKVPATSASHGVHEYLSISMRIDRDTGVIAEVDSTAVTGLVRNWIAELLIGVDFRHDIEPITREIESHYLGHAAGSIKQAVTDAWRRYAAYRKG
jgi:hypothetical protein